LRRSKPTDERVERGEALRWLGGSLPNLLKGALSTLRSRELAAVVRRDKPRASYSSPDLDVRERQKVCGELHEVIDFLEAGLQKTMVNSFLRSWSTWWNWILAGLILAAVVLPELRGATVSAAVLITLGGAAVVAWTWRMRPSGFDIARRLDSSAGLQDRISTALYFSASFPAEGMIERQRQDAIARFRQLDARSLFPFRAPETMRRTLALLLAVAVLFTYRMYYRPPLIALLHTTAIARLVQSIATPLKKGPEEGIQRSGALTSEKEEAAGESNRPAESVQSLDDSAAPPKGAIAGDDPHGESSGEGNPDPSSKPGAMASMSRALLDALKAMLANQPALAGAKPQSHGANDRQGNPNQNTPSDGGDTRDAQQGADSIQKNPQGTANGAGDQQAGSKDLKKSTPLSVKSIPDRVPLQANNLKDQPRMDVSAEAGTAKIATGNSSPRTTAVVNGQEQESIPARYRSYVQRYFQHPDSEKK
jgi:hypothetical protein